MCAKYELKVRACIVREGSVHGWTDLFPRSLWKQHHLHRAPVRPWRHPPARRTVGSFRQRRLLTFLFWSPLCGFWDITPTLSADLAVRHSTLPSRLSTGIQQRWNGCLKRTIHWVKAGLWLLWNEGWCSCHVTLPPFCFAHRFHTGSEMHVYYSTPQMSGANPAANPD